MPELSHDTAEDGFHEIQLSGKQLVFLFIVVTFASVSIFLCGVMIGRGARAARGEEPPVDTAAATIPAASSQPAAESGPPAAEPPAPAPEADELSYHKRLQGEGAADDKVMPPAAEPPATKPAPQPEPKAAAPAQPVTPPAAAATGAARPGAWVVQVVALQDRAVATSLVTRLTGKGYPAFLVTSAAGSVPRMYKVQVGRYNDRREAEQVRQRLEKEEQFKPWISR